MFLVFFNLAPLAILILLSISKEWGTAFKWDFTLEWILTVPVLFKSSMMWSLLFATITMFGTLFISAAISYGILTGKFKGSLLIDAIIMMPLTISHVVIGLGLIVAYKSPPLKLHGTIWIIIFGHFIIAVPYAYRTIKAMLESIDLSLVEAAVSLGASEPVAFVRVILPLAAPGLIACSVISFIISFESYALTMMVAPERIQTIPIQLFHYLYAETGGYTNYSIASAMSVYMIFCIFGLNLIIKLITGRSWHEKITV
jgi:ABC-type spermidine/putrescine transport system permease subunit II